MSGSGSAADEEALTPAVLLWAGSGTVVQIVLVVTGHYSDPVYAVWPVPTLVTAVLTAAAYVIHVRRSPGDSVWHGGMVGGICAFLGTSLAAILADVPALDLATVTTAAFVFGAAGGWLTFLVVVGDTAERPVGVFATHDAKNQENSPPLSDEAPTGTPHPGSDIDLDYRVVFESAPDGIVVVDDRGLIVEVNPRAEAQFGYSAEELVGRRVETLVPEAYRDAHVGRRIGFQGEPTVRPMGIGMELSGRRKDGSAFPVEISLSPAHAREQGLVIAVVRDVTERSRLRAFGHGALRAAEEERQRISRELHDDTAQLLAGLLVRVRLAAGEENAGRRDEMLEELREGLHEASESVRRIARGLRPPALEDAGVVAALRAYIRNLFENQDIRSSFDAGAVDPLLDADRKLVLYRVVQEALSNVVRHSGARTVHVEVKVERGWVVAVVEDDGVGFEEARIGDGGGLGLVGMRERAVSAGGRVSVESTLGEGTCVTLTIPQENGVTAHG